MDCRVIITETAIRDLSEIVRFIAPDNPQAAERTGLLLIAKTEILGRFPEMRRRPPEKGLEHLREIVAPPYRIFYRFNVEENIIEIRRFWHGARGTPVIIAEEKI